MKSFKLSVIMAVMSFSITALAQDNTLALTPANGNEILQYVNLDGIILNMDDLEKVGITYKNKQFNLIVEEYYKISKKTPDDFAQALSGKGYKAKSGIYRKGVSVAPSSILPDDEPLVYNGWNHTAGTYQFPVAVTIEYVNSGEQGKSSISTMYLAANSPALKELAHETAFRWEKDKFVPKISKLLPVTFIAEGSGGSNTTVKFHFWFYLTKELIDKLPEKYQDGLLQEIGLADRINNGVLSPDKACDSITSNDAYLDICESRAGALFGITVYPNPVITNAKCRLVLNDSRIINAMLYDGGGAKISSIIENSTMGKGNNDFDIPFDELPSGIYILVLTTEKSERISSKIIVTK